MIQRTIFSLFDVDGDKVITFEELGIVLRQARDYIITRQCSAVLLLLKSDLNLNLNEEIFLVRLVSPRCPQVDGLQPQ